MGMNEEETKYHLINPVLREKGYDEPQRIKLETPAPVEPTGPKGRRRKGTGRTDYLLCVQVGDMPTPLPVAVLEAKRESEDPLKGMQQAKGYALCKRFDAKYVFATNGHRYAEFDDTSGLQSGPFPFADLFQLLCQNGGPEQKVIIFCTREIHADRVAMQMNNLYAHWCKQQGRTPKDLYAFKCMGGPHNLDDFRTLWIEARQRRQLIDQLLGDNFSPDVIREIDQMSDFDLYDFFGHHGYHAAALKRPERGERYISHNRDWFDAMDADAAIVLRGLGPQFAQGGTDALETPALWEVPALKSAGGLDALRALCRPARVMHEAKGRLFGI